MRIGVFFLILMGIGLVAGGCSRNLEGEVFLDENGNNKKDDGEALIANITYSVTVDDDKIVTAATASDGSYEQSLDKPGTYCVEVSNDSLITSSSSTSAVIVTSSSLTDSTTDDSSTSDSSGTSSSSDSGSDSSSGSTTTTPTTTSGGSSSSSSSSATASSGKACNETVGTSLTLDVPIAVDYSSAVTSLTDPATQTVSRGASVTLPITFPQSCTFELLSVPLTLTPQVSPSSAYSSTTGQLNLNAVVSASTATLTVSQPMAINQDALATYDLVVKVNEDGSVGNTTITLTPKVDCPNSTTVTLQNQTIAVTSDDDIKVTQSMSGTAALGETIVITTTIQSNTSASYSSDQVELKLTTPEFTTNQQYDASCNNSGETATCAFAIAGNSTTVLVTSYTLPTSLSSDTTFTTTASLDVTANGATSTYTGNSVSFSLQKSE